MSKIITTSVPEFVRNEGLPFNVMTQVERTITAYALSIFDKSPDVSGLVLLVALESYFDIKTGSTMEFLLGSELKLQNLAVEFVKYGEYPYQRGNEKIVLWKVMISTQ